MHPPPLPLSISDMRQQLLPLIQLSDACLFLSLPSQVFKACGFLTPCASLCVLEPGRKRQDGQASEKDWMYNVCVLASDSACQWFLLLSVCTWLQFNTTPSLPFLKLHSYLRLILTGGSSSLYRLVAVSRQIIIAMAITLLACFSDGYYEPLKGARLSPARAACYRQAYSAKAVIKLSNWILSERWLVFSSQFF